jgi:tRNA(Met) C34 N-acetyltransferase TmcA
MTATCGCGKSAAMGVSLAAAISLGFSQIGAMAPEPEALVAVFELCVYGLNTWTLSSSTILYQEETKSGALSIIFVQPELYEE